PQGTLNAKSTGRHRTCVDDVRIWGQIRVLGGPQEREDRAGLLVQSHVHLPEQGYLWRNLVHRHKYTF
ncbi:hypothetical protein, partial [Hallerella sp.]|uniref:hypothetical protein n=1 Tax=Hallerella sp. TaxID=2815812 RepID=UPI002584D52E